MKSQKFSFLTIQSLVAIMGLTLLGLIAVPHTAEAQSSHRNHHKSSSKASSSSAFDKDKYAALIVDASTGTVLHQENANQQRYPASLTKMMTLYLTFEALESHRLKLNQMLPVSAFAASRPRMNLSLKEGNRISVRDAILSVIVRSANDAAVVLAEAISGSENNFAGLMTERAQQLGMSHTSFRNASGLPNADQQTTAYDLARLAIALRRDFPSYYPLFARTSFTFKGRVWEGHNHVTQSYPGADGLKTGFVNASGFNLVTSATRGDTKLIGVVLGGTSATVRDRRMVSLLDKYFAKLGAPTPSRTAKVSSSSTQTASNTTKVTTKKQIANNLKTKKKYTLASKKVRSNKKYTSIRTQKDDA